VVHVKHDSVITAILDLQAI